MAGKVVVSTLNDDTGVLATQNGMTGIAKAWLNYDGTAQSIRGSFNVSSVTYNAAGDYTVNFTTAMANGNYSAVAQVSPLFGVYAGLTNIFDSSAGEVAGTTTAFRFTARRADNSALVNLKYVCVSIFSS
jgi:hypothetical protein